MATTRQCSARQETMVLCVPMIKDGQSMLGTMKEKAYLVGTHPVLIHFLS